MNPEARYPAPQPGAPAMTNPIPVSTGVPGTLDVKSEGNVVIPPARLPQRFTPAAPENLAPAPGLPTMPMPGATNTAPPVPVPTSGGGIPATFPTSAPTMSSLPNMR